MEQLIAIMDEIPLAIHDSVDSIGQIPADLAHPQPIGIGRDTRILNLARR
jgi:hypothetical protein